MILLTDEARKELGLSLDCGSFDLVKNRWQISERDLERYRPDVLKLVGGYKPPKGERRETQE